MLGGRAYEGTYQEDNPMGVCSENLDILGYINMGLG
jgi:hypothetical protein